MVVRTISGIEQKTVETCPVLITVTRGVLPTVYHMTRGVFPMEKHIVDSHNRYTRNGKQETRWRLGLGQHVLDQDKVAGKEIHRELLAGQQRPKGLPSRSQQEDVKTPQGAKTVDEKSKGNLMSYFLVESSIHCTMYQIKRHRMTTAEELASS
jgi:hypothetical protein